MARQYAVPGLGPPVLFNGGTHSGTEALAGSSTFVNDVAGDLAVAPGAGSVVFTGLAPGTTINAVAAPGVGSVLFTGLAPSADAAVAPGVGSVVFTGFAPGTTIDATVAPGAGSILFTGFEPTDGATVAPGTGSVVFTGFAPSPDETVAPGAGSILFTGFAPSQGTFVAPGAGSVVFTGFAPSPDETVAPGVGSIRFTGFAPRPDEAVAPGVGSIRFTGFAPTVVIVVGKVTVADLWFSHTAGFVDLTSNANRRLFVSPAGGAQSLGSDGSRPFQVTPPVFLSSNGTPATFASNNGRGHAFSISSGALANGASNPPATSETVTTYAAVPTRWGVVGDYLTGNIYSFNPATYTDNGTRRRWVRRWRSLPQNTFAAIKFTSLSVEMQTGAGVPNTANPQVLLRWSDDGGRSWSDQRIVEAGKSGQTTQTIKFNRLGSTRRWAGCDRLFELSCADPFMIAILDADVDA